MEPDRIAIVGDMPGEAGRFSSEAQFPRNDFLREVSFADKIRNDINFRAVHHSKHLAKGWLLFPKRTNDLCEDAAVPDGVGVFVRGLSRVRIEGRAVARQHESAVRFGKHWGSAPWQSVAQFLQAT